MNNRLFVGNLSYTTTEATLQSLFGQDGRTVNSVEIVKDKETGRSAGFGFVEMANDNDAKAAISALHGTEIDGRRVQVDIARPRRPRTDSPPRERFSGRPSGGGFDRGGGGGGGRGDRDRDRGRGGERSRRWDED
jgi:RNA recognition motif-containing protein